MEQNILVDTEAQNIQRNIDYMDVVQQVLRKNDYGTILDVVEILGESCDHVQLHLSLWNLVDGWGDHDLFHHHY